MTGGRKKKGSGEKKREWHTVIFTVSRNFFFVFAFGLEPTHKKWGR